MRYEPGPDEGKLAPGKRVTFEGVLAEVTPQVILTDFLVDRIYPVTPSEGTAVAARVKKDIVGTHRSFAGGGSAKPGSGFVGATPPVFRPRSGQCHLRPSRALGPTLMGRRIPPRSAVAKSGG